MKGFLIIVLFTLGLGQAVFGQEMYIQSQKYHNKWRSTMGLGAAEPLAVHVQLYRGFSCQSLRSWLIEAQVGMEGLLYQTAGSPYLDGTWDGGALRYSLSFNQRMFRFVSDYIPWMGFLAGVGIQGGQRNYLDQNQEQRKNYALGPVLNFNIETYILDKRINRTDYLGVIAFAEYLYHREFEQDFQISRINGGIRLNFYN